MPAEIPFTEEIQQRKKAAKALAQKKYVNSEKGRAKKRITNARYMKSEKGQAILRRALKKYQATEEYKIPHRQVNKNYRIKSNPEKKRAQWLKNKYGLSYEDATRMLQEQDSKCAICLDDLSLLRVEGKQMAHLDHCHETGKNRGFLCSNCNTGLGLLKDSIQSLSNAIGYLSK